MLPRNLYTRTQVTNAYRAGFSSANRTGPPMSRFLSASTVVKEAIGGKFFGQQFETLLHVPNQPVTTAVQCFGGCLVPVDTALLPLKKLLKSRTKSREISQAYLFFYRTCRSG